MVVDLFQAKGVSPWLPGGALLAVAALVAAAFVLRLGEWVPALLFGSAFILFIAGVAAGHTSIEGLAVMVAVILATGVAFLSEYKSDREFEVLNAHKDALHVKTIRGGEVHSLSMEEIVVGDVVVLETGDEIPADGRVVKATELYVDQSLMTGEAEPVRKQPRPADDTAEGPEQPGCLYRGTQVVDGIGEMLVTEVGDATYLGQIARRLSAEDDEEDGAGTESEEKRVKHKLTISKAPTPLQLKLEKLADLISNVGYIAALAIFVALLARGMWTGELHFSPRGGETTPQAQASGQWQRGAQLLRLHGDYHRRRCAGRLADERDRFAGPGHAQDDAGQQPGPATGRLRDHRLGNHHLLRQDRHADTEQDAGRAGVLRRHDARPLGELGTRNSELGASGSGSARWRSAFPSTGSL